MSQLAAAPGIWSSHGADLTLAARTHVPVLITGARTAERFACARLIHNTGTRKAARFVAITCDAGALGDSTWNHVAGLHGAELRIWLVHARGGTMFIDSLDMMSAELQDQFSHALDHGFDRPDSLLHDVRIVTGAPTGWAAAGRGFSDRLYYRLNVMRIDHSRLQESLAVQQPAFTPRQVPGARTFATPVPLVHA